MAKIQHLALLKFKEGTTTEQIDGVFTGLLDLSESIPGIENFTGGANNSPEGLSQGFTHAMVMTFTDAAARDAYLAHADHAAFLAANQPLVENVAVVDFEI